MSENVAVFRAVVNKVVYKKVVSSCSKSQESSALDFYESS